ncbi:hypothetical protein NQ488_04835 [[Bacteroides] pectinophilus]|uniref:Uncharacterized protein n=1 Tax=[Bacteroides] pectinophilus ATCC 43243 TaxID=483218 RepID=B7AR42_9FIRM|nr:hypothetical protein BACPEC_01152 [[Bacteroides] pectinophilus ATCC 43243]UWN96630.1 hypothetical protein NQ488_04835 [[Bacteroides] pectinophilus]
MKYPCLVPARMCKTDIMVHLESEEVDECSNPVRAIDIETKCNYQDKAKTVLTAEKKLTQITGTALFAGDIAPEFPTVGCGYVVIHGEKRIIAQGSKARNPDGTVNYTSLEVK